MIKFGVLTNEQDIIKYLPALTNDSRFRISFLLFSEHFATSFYEIPVATSYLELLERTDAILYLGRDLPSSQHIETALKKFKPVFLEKPLSFSLSEFKILLKIAEEVNVLIHKANPLLSSYVLEKLKRDEFKPSHLEIRRSMLPGIKFSRFKEMLIEDIEFSLIMIHGNPVKISVNGIRSDEALYGFLSAHIEFDSGKTTHLSYNLLQRDEKVVAEIYQSENFFRIDYSNSNIVAYNLSKDGTRIPGKSVVLKKTYPIHQDPFNDFKSEVNRFYMEVEEKIKPEISLEVCYTAISTANRICEKIPEHVILPSW